MHRLVAQSQHIMPVVDEQVRSGDLWTSNRGDRAEMAKQQTRESSWLKVESVVNHSPSAGSIVVRIRALGTSLNFDVAVGGWDEVR